MKIIGERASAQVPFKGNVCATRKVLHHRDEQTRLVARNRPVSIIERLRHAVIVPARRCHPVAAPNGGFRCALPTLHWPTLLECAYTLDEPCFRV